ncbi:MAG: hypothetical protein U0235_10905 [Polyangiaceae bacterium]
MLGHSRGELVLFSSQHSASTVLAALASAAVIFTACGEPLAGEPAPEP